MCIRKNNIKNSVIKYLLQDIFHGYFAETFFCEYNFSATEENLKFEFT